jgi:hypothetical protein
MIRNIVSAPQFEDAEAIQLANWTREQLISLRWKWDQGEVSLRILRIVR